MGIGGKRDASLGTTLSHASLTVSIRFLLLLSDTVWFFACPHYHHRQPCNHMVLTFFASCCYWCVCCTYSQSRRSLCLFYGLAACSRLCVVILYFYFYLFLFFFRRFVVAVIFSFLTQFVIKNWVFFLSHFCVFPVLIEVISDNDPFFGDCFHSLSSSSLFFFFYEFRALFWVLFLLLPHLNFGHNGIKPHFFPLCPQIPNVV